MELRHLRYFTTLAETLSFTQAAESLFVSQSTLSQQIAALEQELGIKLFERTKRSVVLSDAGRAMLPAARRILQEVDHLGPVAHSGASAEAELSVRIGMDQRIMYCTALKSTLTECLFKAREKALKLQVSFVVHEYEELSHGLDDGSIDVSFFLHQEPIAHKDGSLVSTCLFEDEMVMAIRMKEPLRDSPETIRELALRRGVILLGREGRGLMQATRLFDDLEIAPSISLVPMRDSLLLMLGSGECTVLLPQSLLNELSVPDIQVLHFRSPHATLYGLATWNTRNPNPLIEQLVTAARGAFEMGVRNFGMQPQTTQGAKEAPSLG